MGQPAFGRMRRSRLPWQRVCAALAAIVAVAVLAWSPLVLAQADGLAVGTVLRVANTDGEPLNLRAGPSIDQPVVERLTADATLTVTGPAQLAGATRWLPVVTGSGQRGWVAAQYTAVVSVPTPTRTPLVEVVAVASPEPQTADPLAAASPTPLLPSGAAATTEPPVRPVEVEVKLKYPEAKGRHQEITVWVLRDGAPVPGALVTLRTSADDQDELPRELEPTNEEGRTRREFSVGQEKGSIELEVVAVAPDGGEGRATVTYFRR